MGWMKRASLGFAIIAPLKDIIGMAVWKEQFGGTEFGSADQPEHWAWTDRKMAYGLRCAELKGAGMGSKALAKEALARRPLIRRILAREALANKVQIFAQTFVRDQVSEYGRRP